MSWIAGNRALTRSESDNNARIVTSFFRQQRWNDMSIAAIVGCMYAESYINPQLWEEGMPQWGSSTGFGLVQWTPATRLSEKAAIWGLGNYMDGTVQLRVIMGEYTTTNSDLKEWFGTNAYPISFRQWATNSVGYDIDNLVQAFIVNYLRPYNPNQPRYQQAARRWYNIMLGGDPDVPIPGPAPGPGPTPPGPQPGQPLDAATVALLRGYTGLRNELFYGRH